MNAALGCSGQVISESLIDFFDIDSRSKALGDEDLKKDLRATSTT